MWREVEITVGAASASVSQLDLDGFVLVCSWQRRSADLMWKKKDPHEQVTLAVLPHKGLLFGLPPGVKPLGTDTECYDGLVGSSITGELTGMFRRTGQRRLRCPDCRY